MSLFVVDQKKCKRDGICVDECPFGIIERIRTMSVPTLSRAPRIFASGLGTCWAGLLNHAAGQWPALQQALDFPEGHVSFGAMMVGYPHYQYHRLPLRNEARIIWR